MPLLLLRNLVQDGSRNSRMLLWSLHSVYFKSFSNIALVNGETSFTYSYLVQSCGLSPASARTACQKFNLRSSKNPDSVLAFFREHGFTKTQIKDVIRKRPFVLGAKPDTTLKPKVGVLHQLGLSRPFIAKVLSADPNILTRSVDSHLVPSIDFLKSILHTNENVATALKRSTRILIYRPDHIMPPNIDVLRSHSVPMENIERLVKLHPGALMGDPQRLNDVVIMAKGLGLDPRRLTFIRAVRVYMAMTKEKWENKLEALRSVGWSDDDIMSALKVEPFLMANSGEKMKKVVDYFVKEWDYSPSAMAKRPVILALSLEKRIIPRCELLRVLLSKGLIKKAKSLFLVVELAELKFLEKFVTKYQEKDPKILKTYKQLLSHKNTRTIGDTYRSKVRI